MSNALERASDIAKARAPGENVHYDPDVHPGLVKRLTLCGHEPGVIAGLLGVGLPTFERWCENHADLAEMVAIGAMLRDAEVMESIYDQAIGYVDDRGRRRGANVTAAKFIIMNRFGWTDKLVQSPKHPHDPDREVSPEGLIRAAEELIRTLRVQQSDAAEVVEGKAFTEFD